MPVPTETLRNMRVLNAVFAVSSVLLLLSTVWLVLADYNRPWRIHQREAIRWDAAMTRGVLEGEEIKAARGQIEAITAELAELEQQVASEQGDELAEYEQTIAAQHDVIERLKLPLANEKGRVNPKLQEIELASSKYGPDMPEAKALREELKPIQDAIAEMERQTVEAKQAKEEAQAQIAKIREQISDRDVRLMDLQRKEESLQERLAQLHPTGVEALTKLIRDSPLLDWLNPSEKVQQVVVPEVLIDLNFMRVESIDRCHSCHFNIDKPAFEREQLRVFAERQVAGDAGTDINKVEQPSVMIRFWHNAADALPTLRGQLKGISDDALRSLNEVRADAGLQKFENIEQLLSHAMLDTGVTDEQASAWHERLRYLRDDLQAALKQSLGKVQYERLAGLYWHQLVERFNDVRESLGQQRVSANPVLLAHPQLDLYARPQAPHALKTMGCTVCHEGSGQESDFNHSAHVPRDMWVDAKTGAPVPDFLVTQEASSSGHVVGLSGGGPLEGYSHDDLPVKPRHDRVEEVWYLDPSAPDAAPRRAITQAAHWEREYHWHHVHSMDWEKPMHAMQYIESSCAKCHDQVFDVKFDAPKLFKGRQLFTQLGCVNCHAVGTLADAMDVKRVGPSLVHVKEKLSEDMVASWIWAPKALRPTTKMPHYFMLENNSSPTDILRTRTEVAAITYYLMNASPSTDYYTPGAPPAYELKLPPDEQGSAKRGRKLFNEVGCRACHMNMHDDAAGLIVPNLMAREGLSEGDAQTQFDAMGYDDQHWYALAHMEDKLQRFGPELSGVGTKLLAGRTPEQARTWLYNWLINPRNYNHYTVMPSFRLSDQEASDLAAYLLTLQRPNYTPATFLPRDEEGKVTLDARTRQMLDELVKYIIAAGGDRDVAQETINETMPTDEAKLLFLGQKSVQHYGCNGCHLVNGFEASVSACTELNEWGLKDPHKIDFAYFEHAFSGMWSRPQPVWKVAREGLVAGAPHITPDSAAGDGAAIARRDLKWEHINGERRPWLYHKLHNTRVFDRGKYPQTAQTADPNAEDFDLEAAIAQGKPYDKLKMPKFFLSDDQVEALITFVTSVRKPLVKPSLREVYDDAGRRATVGAQVATVYNCYGCHNVEGNEPYIWKSMSVKDQDGRFDYTALNNAPPRLIGQGAKTQPDWLIWFLQNVHELRPWLKVRMPSFFNEIPGHSKLAKQNNERYEQHRNALADFFAGWSESQSATLYAVIEKIDKVRETDPKNWFNNTGIRYAVGTLRDFAFKVDLIRPSEIDPRTTPDKGERREKWNKVLKDVRFFARALDIEYPFAPTPRPDPPAHIFERGEQMATSVISCKLCHAMGDPEILDGLWQMQQSELAEQVAVDEEEAQDDEGEDWDDDEGEDEEDDWGDVADADEPEGPQYSAPNLAFTARRLQWKWVNEWLLNPQVLQPGTNMPGFWDQGSAFPGADELENLYGHTGAQQRQVLMDFLYAMGLRNYTPDQHKVLGLEKPQIPLDPLPKPPPEPVVQVEPEPEEPEEPQGEAAPTGGSSVVGTITFNGMPPSRGVLRMGADRFCQSAHDTRVRSEAFIVDADTGGVQNVLVYVKEGLPGKKYRPPSEPALLDQRGCMYLPHVLAIQAGQSVAIRTSDETLHNVDMKSKNNGKFNKGMPRKGMVITHKFKKPELSVALKCAVHPWMNAKVHVLAHPFFAVTDASGQYEITGMLPGTYTLEAVHESDKIPPVQFEVTLDGAGEFEADAQIARK